MWKTTTNYCWRCNLRLRALCVLLLVACANSETRPDGDLEARARALAMQVRDAAANGDDVTYIKLTDANMRTRAGRGDFTKEDIAPWIDAILQKPVRVVTTPQGVAFIGWANYRSNNDKLAQVVVGEARAICHYTRLYEGTKTTDVPDWKVAVVPFWYGAMAGNPNQRAAVEAELAKFDDAVLASWFFEGDEDAEKTVKRALNRVGLF